MEIDEQTLQGIIDRLNDLDQRNVHIWKTLDHLEKLINELNGNQICNI